MIGIGSLFSGIGGLEVGVAAGLGVPATVRWQCEQDEFCRGVLAARFPGVECYPDVRELDPETLPAVDVLVGGFPCQDVSGAGKGAGLAGERSGLWSEFRRIAAGMRPAALVIENVASGAKRWVDAVRADLDAIGYASVPCPVSAADVGAPHYRRRIFVVALDRAQSTGRIDPSSALASHLAGSVTAPEPLLAATRTPAALLDYEFRGQPWAGRRMRQWRYRVAEAVRAGRCCPVPESDLDLEEDDDGPLAMDMFPTPTATQYTSSGNGCPGDGRQSYAHAGTPSLSTIGRQWPTPLANDAKNQTASAVRAERAMQPGSQYAGLAATASAGGVWPTCVTTDAASAGRETTLAHPDNTMKPGVSLTDSMRKHTNAAPTAVLDVGFCEALMGFPVGWTSPGGGPTRQLPFPPVPADGVGWAAYQAAGGPAPGTLERAPQRSKRIRAIGNAVVPQCAEVVGAFVASLLGATVGRRDRLEQTVRTA